jgi:hypothetical protein
MTDGIIEDVERALTLQTTLEAGNDTSANFGETRPRSTFTAHMPTM